MATVLSRHCHGTLARYVTVCNTVAVYCLPASSHSVGSAAEQAADKSTLKYTMVTEQQMGQIFPTIYCLHTFIMVAYFVGIYW